MQHSLLARAGIVLFLVVLLLVPLQMIRGVIDERAARRTAAVAEVASTWGSAQTLVGPVLIVPFRVERKETWVEPAPAGALAPGVARERTRSVVERAIFLPDTLKIEGRLVPERRWRGIFEVVLYRTELSVSGSMPAPDLAALGVPPEDVLWKDAIFSVGLSDTRGIREEVRLLWDGAPLPFRAGSGSLSFAASGIQAPLAALEASPPGSHAHAFAFSVSLQGTESFAVAPLGASTETALVSPWPSPSFFGAFLPDRRSVASSGFSAAWKVSSFGRSYPQRWRSDRDAPGEAVAKSSFGVRLFLPADAYQQATRALKYAILFVGLTFLAFALFETFAGVRLHPLQYLLVGCALVLFYLLLVSVSEHVGFGTAYLAAASATTALVSVYCAWVLVVKTRALVIAAALAGLYGYLFVLLRLEDYALLLGAVTLFVLLAAIMLATRRVDWWSPGAGLAPPHRYSPPPVPPARA
jgi:inner membrane protein